MKLRPWMKCIEAKYGFIVDMERKIKAIENEHDETYDLDEEVGYALGTQDMAVCQLRIITSEFNDDRGAGLIMDEKTIEHYLRNEVKKLGGIAFKFVSPGNAGVPDRIVLLPGGTVKFVELKKPGGKTSPIQNLQISKMRKLGNDVRIIDSLEKVDALIGEMTL